MKTKFSQKKLLLSVLLMSLVSLSMFSLSGYTENLPTESGEYIYFRDYTFAQETYIGFLYYSEENIGVRCFSKNNFDVHILFSLDSSKDYIELTGEKIVSQVTPNDVEIVNYIHDMVYELASRRKKVQNEFLTLKEQNSPVTKQFVVEQDFVQFGGQVQITFDGSIPVFNLESITDVSGKVLLKAISMGTLSDSADTSFENFFGFENLPEEKEVVKKKKLSRKEIKAFEYKKTQLDSLWQTVENMPGIFKTLGDSAILWEFPLEIIRDTNKKESSKQIFDYFTRNNRLSSNGTYVYLPKSSVKEEKLLSGNIIQISKMTTYSPSAKEKYSINYKILMEENGTFKMVNFTAYESWIQENQDYADYILDSIKQSF